MILLGNTPLLLPGLARVMMGDVQVWPSDMGGQLPEEPQLPETRVYASFDGVNDYAQANLALPNPSTYAIRVRFRVDYGALASCLLLNGALGSGYGGWGIMFYTGGAGNGLQLVYGSGGSNLYLNSGYITPKNQWLDLVMLSQGGRLYFLIEGQVFDLGPFTSPAPMRDVLTFGGGYNRTSINYQCRADIDEFLFFDDPAMTPANVLAITANRGAATRGYLFNGDSLSLVGGGDATGYNGVTFNEETI